MSAKSNYLGSEFIWWIGQVKDISDPNKCGRVKVRIYSLHDSDEIEDSSLPWAPVVVPATSGFPTNGSIPLGLTTGSIVFGFFTDGNNKQHPLVLGTWATQNDAITLANKSATSASQRNARDYAPEYPYNNSTVSKSGHIVEVDDTPGHERLLQQHKSGTFSEVYHDGVRQDEIKGQYLINVDGYKLEIKCGATTVTITDGELKVDGNLLVTSAASGIITDHNGKVITIQDGIVINIA